METLSQKKATSIEVQSTALCEETSSFVEYCGTENALVGGEASTHTEMVNHLWICGPGNRRKLIGVRYSTGAPQRYDPLPTQRVPPLYYFEISKFGEGP